MYQFPSELRTAYESMTVPFAYYQFVDGEVRPVLVSDGLCKQMNLERGKLISLLSSSLFSYIHPDDVGQVSRLTYSFANHESEYEIIFRSRHAEDYHYIYAVGHWQIMPDGTELAVLTYANISKAEKTIEHLNHQYNLFQQDQFYRDPLTGLPNINYLQEFADERIAALRAENRTPVLYYFDVVSMQFYNNQYGFDKGNELLRLIASSLETCFPGALLCRGADDHFILIDAWQNEEDTFRRLSEVNERIRTAAYGNTSGIQAGVCVFDRNTRTGEAIDRARNALRQIGSDLNTLYRLFSPLADEQYWNERYIVQNLDQALEEKWIRVFYQGISMVSTGRTACFEALARWNDPNRGTISPGEFIPVLEKYHLLYKLDLYMMEQVCREIPLRAESGLPLLPVSVNFAAQDFEYRNIPEEIEALYQRYEMSKYVPRSCFVLEITERDIAMMTDRLREQLDILRNHQYQVWLDDFGSGYSSLNVFSHVNVDLIKFDMALIQDLDSRSGLNRKIIAAMIGIARDLKIHTLAEGVEMPQQLEFLREVGCELSQGFLCRKPESLSAILFRLANGSLRPDCEPEENRRRFFGRDSVSPD